MAERIAVILALALLIAVAVFAVRRWNARNMQSILWQAPAWDVLGERPDGRRTIIAFSSRSCAACHTAQAPAIERAQQHLGIDSVRLIRVDIARQPEVARAFGVMTVPSTVVVAESGKRIVAVNQGFAPSGKLLDQLRHA